MPASDQGGHAFGLATFENGSPLGHVCSGAAMTPVAYENRLASGEPSGRATDPRGQCGFPGRSAGLSPLARLVPAGLGRLRQAPESRG
jgi:hypothetical protein